MVVLVDVPLQLEIREKAMEIESVDTNFEK